MASMSISGLGGGLDFGALADAIIALEREPIARLETQKKNLQLKKDMMNEVLNALNNVKTKAKALGDPTKLSFTSTTSSRESALLVSANSSAALGSYSVTVHQLATASRVTSGFATSLGISAKADLNQNLNEKASNLGRTFTGGYITINGTQVAVNVNETDSSDPATNDTLQELIDRINSTVTGVTASYDAATDKIALTSAASITVGSPDDTSNFLKMAGLASSPEEMDGLDYVRTSNHRLGRVNTSAAMADLNFGTALTGSGTFTINGVEISYDASVDSLNDVISRINTNVSTVVASYDSQTDKLILASKTTGSLGITRGDGTGNFLEVMGLLDGAGDSSSVTALGQNAKITIPGFNNGDPIYSTSNTVTEAIPGVTLTLKEADPAKPVEISVNRNADELKTKLQDFVTAYNEAIQLVHSRMTEAPLENPVSNTTSRVGLLRGDVMLARIKMEMNTALLSTITGLTSGFNRMGAIGVTTDPNDYKTGQIKFDAEVFQEKIDENFQLTYDVLFEDANRDGTINDGERGMIPRLLEQLETMIDSKNTSFNGYAIPNGDIPRRNYSYDQEMKSLTTRIDDLEQRLELRETSLRARFMAAQRAINSFGGSANALSAYFAQPTYR